MTGVLSTRMRMGLAAVALAFIMSMFMPLINIMRQQSPTDVVLADGSAGISFGTALTPWGWGYITVTNPHWGYTYPGVSGTHRTLTIKAWKGTIDSNAWVRIHISKANENPTGCLLIWDSMHQWMKLKICDPSKWNARAWLYVALGTGAVVWWLVGPAIVVAAPALAI